MKEAQQGDVEMAIHEEAITVPNATTNNAQRTSSSVRSFNVRVIYSKLGKCLRNKVAPAFSRLPCFDKSSKEPVTEPSKEAQAYIKLMEHVEHDLIKQFPAKRWAYYILIFIMLIAFLATARAVRVVHVHHLLDMRIASWTFLLIVLVSGFPLVQFITFILTEPLIWGFRLQKYVFLFGRMLKTDIDVTLWFAFVLLVWYTWYRPEVAKDTRGRHVLHTSLEEYTHVLKIVVREITRLLLAINIGALLWTIKKAIFLKLLADLHFTQLCDYIKQTFLDFTAICYIEKKKATIIDTNHNVENGREEENLSEQKRSKDEVIWMNISELKKERVPTWILKLLIDKYMEYFTKRKNDLPKILKLLQDTDDNAIILKEAKKLLKNVIGNRPDNSDIDDQTLKEYGLEEEEIRRRVFKLLSDDGTPNRITQDQFLRWAVKAVKRCKGLKRTVESSQHVFGKLEVLMNVFVVVLTVIIWLLLSELVSSDQIAILFAPFISASFIFGDNLRKSFDGIMFVFGLHPFDVGDHVIIDKVELKVIELSLLKTRFRACDGGEETIYPNSELSTKPIINLEVEPDQVDSIDFTVPIETPHELICDLQVKIKKTLDDDVTFASETVVAKKEASDEKVTLSVYFKYLVTSETKAKHRSKVLCKIIRLRKQMENEFRKLKDENSMSFSQEEEVPVDRLRFEIACKLKLSEIERLKKITLGTIKIYEPSLKGCFPQVVLTDIKKEKIIMDVRMRRHTDLLQTKEDKDKFKQTIDDAIQINKPDPRNENVVNVYWLSIPDMDDDC